MVLTRFAQESSRSWCRRHGIEEQRLYEMVKLKQQFESVMKDYLGVKADYADSEDNDESYESGKRKRRKEEDRDVSHGDCSRFREGSLTV